ncbi:MAG: ABC transporter permease [Candidatus Aminicenantia bacterium]
MKVLKIALNTFKEAIRNRIYFLFIFFALFFLFSSRILSLLTIGDEIKVMKDIGLATLSLFQSLIALFIGVDLIFKEMEKKTLYNILSKPISRIEFLLGKFIGVGITLLINILFLGFIFLLYLFLNSKKLEPIFLLAFLLIYIESLVISSFSILFSTFSTPILSFVFTFFIYIIGHVSFGLWTIIEKFKKPFEKYLILVIYYILPNLENFNLRNEIVNIGSIPEGFILRAIIYGILYGSAIFFLSLFIFHKRDL